MSTQAVRSTTASGSAVYESSRAVDEYLQFHFAKAHDVLPYSEGPSSALNFPAKCAQACVAAAVHSGKQDKLRALDVGCAVGGATFELARGFDEVVGVDYSAAFVAAAETMRTEGQLQYSRLAEGDVFEQRVAQLPAGVDCSRVQFRVGDACALPLAELGQTGVTRATVKCALARHDS
eukprot:18694-Heterococcus_DN1.PRE.3